VQPNLETARRARREIERVRLLLIQPAPQVLEACAEHLRAAARCMADLETALRRESGLAAREALNRELNELRRDLRRVRALVEKAAQLYSGWAALMGRGPEGPDSYRWDGSITAPAVVRRLVVHG